MDVPLEFGHWFMDRGKLKSKAFFGHLVHTVVGLFILYYSLRQVFRTVLKYHLYNSIIQEKCFVFILILFLVPFFDNVDHSLIGFLYKVAPPDLKNFTTIQWCYAKYWKLLCHNSKILKIWVLTIKLNILIIIDIDKQESKWHNNFQYFG